MPEPKRPLKVFLSYASQDKPLVRELSHRLAGEGWIDTWQDEKNLLPGQDWRVKIEEAVEDADVVIIVLSQHSVSKEGHVQKELRYAREIALEKPEDAIFLIPLRLDECDVPRGLRFYQWVDYFGDNKDSSYKALIASLNLRYEQKIKTEQVESLLKEIQEREFAEKIAREKAEKSLLKAEEEDRQRIAKEKVEREAANKLSREKVEKEAAEKARLEAEDLDRQITAKEKAKREATERAERERKEIELREKQVRDARENGKSVSEKKEGKPVAVKPKSSGQIAYWLGGFIVLVLGIILLSSLNNPSSVEQPTPEKTQTQAITNLTQGTVEPSATVTPKSTSTPIITLTPTPLPTEITDARGVSMVLVPAGEFLMGSDVFDASEKPAHRVYLVDFFIDKYETTNAEYAACVEAGVCNLPKELGSYDRKVYYGNPAFDNYPVIHVDWNMSKIYCEWRDAQLPTEAQWEKAARGTDGRMYPWGEGINQYLANYDRNLRDTTAVGTYENGRSIFGAYDMTGNVDEWVADWYSETYYQNSPASNPLGPDSGVYRVVRGGSWAAPVKYLRISLRGWQIPDDTNMFGTGFRCAKAVTP